MTLIHKLAALKLIHPPKWLPDNLTMLGYAGSVAYGASSDTSDMDCFGICIPPRRIVFPYENNAAVYGFGNQEQRFRVWSEHHISMGEKSYDFSVYNIVDFFQLAMENNPNVLDILFLPRRCILHSTKISEHLRANRKIFLHKGAFHKFRGYAFSQMSKIENKTNSSNPKRSALIEQHGYDTKFAMHVVRLALQAEQILLEHDLDLEKNSEILKSVRRGEWTLDSIKQWFTVKEKSLEILYAKSDLQAKPDQPKLKVMLLECLEMHFGRLDRVDTEPNTVQNLLSEMQSVLTKYSN